MKVMGATLAMNKPHDMAIQTEVLILEFQLLKL